MTVYLDWNAASPRHERVREAMERAESVAWANPSSVHAAGRAARAVMEDCRETLASLLRVLARDVVFTSGGTEANHLALSGARWLVTSHLEHPSIVLEALRLRAGGAFVEFAQVDARGCVTPEAVERALHRVLEVAANSGLVPDGSGRNNQTVPLVAMSAINHETGVLQAVEEVAALVHSLGGRLHLDAVQLLGRGELGVVAHADSVAVAAHKLRGPKGVGALGFACGWTPVPLGGGGAQERGLRPGTVDAVALAGFLAALERLADSQAGYLHAAALGSRFQKSLLEGAQAGTAIHGSDLRSTHVVNFRVPGWKGDELVAALDLEGVCVSSGSACSAGTAEPSPVIEAMVGRDAAVGAVRVSFGEGSDESDLTALLAALRRVGVLSAEPSP